MARRFKNWLLSVLLLFISVTVPLIAFEYYLKWDNARPDARPYLNDVTLNGTSYQFLETLEAIDNPRNAVLIAGDSFTAGISCADGRTFPNAFTRKAIQAGSPLHAVNMGVVGTGPMAYAARVRDYLVEKGSVEGAILALYANDIEIDCFACRHLHEWGPFAHLTDRQQEDLVQFCVPCLQEYSQRESDEIGGAVSMSRRLNWWLADRSPTYVVFREALAKVAVATGQLPVNWGRGAYPERWSNLEGLYFKYVLGSITFAREVTQDFGVPMMVVFFPDPVDISTSNQFFGIYETVGSALRDQAGIPVFSGYEAFIDDPRARKNMPFSLTDTHPDCDANQIFGEWVFDKWVGVEKASVP